MATSNLFYVTMVFLIAVLLGVSGCGTTHTAALDNARLAYNQAQANPTVKANAPVELYEAQQSLEKAQEAGSEAEQRHYAYLAQKQSEQAVHEANRKAAEQQIAAMGPERQEIMLRSREQEAARARAQAEAAQQQAQTAEQRAREAQRQRAAAMGQAEAYQRETQLAQQQAAQLESQLSELKARQTSQGNVMLTMSDVMFATNKAVLNPGAMLSLDKLANILKQNPNQKIYIEGHTDSTGSATYNEQLSAARADAVRQALMQRGVSSDRIIARGLGESFPVASNDTAAGRQLNRRVDIVVTG